MDKIEHRAVIKFFVKKGLTPTEIFDEMKNVLGDSAPSFTTVKKWASEFKRGRTSLEDEPRSGRPKSESFDLFQSEPKELKRKASPENRGKDINTSSNGNVGGSDDPPLKRHHPLTSPNSRSPGITPALLHTPSSKIFDDGFSSFRESMTRHDHFDRIGERFEKDLTRNPLYSELQRNYNDEMMRDVEEEWRNIYIMLNCIMGMVEKTKRALNILQHRSMECAGSLLVWPPFRRHPFPPSPLDSQSDYHDLRKRDHLMPFTKPDDRINDRRIRGNHMEAVNEIKRQAVVELQKAVSAAESKASELIAAERAKMERMISEVRRQAAEDALASVNHQEDSNENCWNCGRKASETCSGCNIARYCGSFCQHKDWESHHRTCGTRESEEMKRKTSPSSTNGEIQET